MSKWWPVWALAVLVVVPASPGQDNKQQGKTYQVPYRMTEFQHVVVRVKINGQGPYNFIVDTGAPLMFVATAIGTKLGLTNDAKGFTTLDRLEIEGGVVLKQVQARVETPFQLEGMNGMGLAGVELHGILGYTILARYRLAFDFSRPKMAWTELNWQPAVPVGIKGKGGSGGLEMIGGFMKILGLLTGAKATPEHTPRGFLGVQFAAATKELVVQSVLPQSPAAAVGLQVGDRLSRVQGKEASSLADLRRLLGKVVAGQTIRFTIVRGQDTKEITITAGEGL